MMRRPVLFATLAVATCVSVVGWRVAQQSSLETFTVPVVTPPEAAPLCPWREPDSDLTAFFPEATRYEIQTRILSGLRPELTRRLGRTPTGDENALRLYEVYRDKTVLGSILTRRAKGEYGGIEIVIAMDTNQCLRGVRLQRVREPAVISAALQNTNWLKSFVGKRADDQWHMGSDIPEVPSEARVSAQAVVEAVRSLSVLAATAKGSQAVGLAAAHH